MSKKISFEEEDSDMESDVENMVSDDEDEDGQKPKVVLKKYPRSMRGQMTRGLMKTLIVGLIWMMTMCMISRHRPRRRFEKTKNIRENREKKMRKSRECINPMTKKKMKMTTITTRTIYRSLTNRYRRT